METPQATDIEGIKCFAPELARSCADYPKEAFAKLAEKKTAISSFARVTP
jgi:hypothetical protein